MLKTGLVICIGLFLFSCGSPAAKKTSEEVKTEVEEPIEARDLVKEYKEYLSSLDSTNEKSVTLATEKYEELFSKSGQKLCDSAFIVFDKFYGKIESNLNDRLMNDQFFVDFPCVSLDSLGVKEKPFEKKFVPFKKNIEKNGFRIECPEGMVEIGQDRSFISKHIYKYVSPLMKEFLEGLRNESDEVFSADAGISITEEEYVDRLVWWENFNKKNPDFILSKRAQSIQRYLFTYFLLGMDNTPVVYDSSAEKGVEKMELDPYFVKAYDYLSKKYPNSDLNALVKPYKMTILKNDNVKREKLIHTYTKRGLMIDFSGTYTFDE